MRRPAAIVLLAALVLLGGCRTRKLPPDASATTQPATTETTQATTTTTLNLAATPTPAQLQDPAYWNAILAALYHVVGDVFRRVVSVRAVEPSQAAALQQVYGPTVFSDQYQSLLDVSGGKDDGVVIPPGDPVASVSSILKANEQCVALAASLDFGRVNTRVPTSPIALMMLPRQRSQLDINPTLWTIGDFFRLDAPDGGNDLCRD